jgi:site-specific DNA recombinase
VSGGLPYARGALYELLRNRLYLGETKHRTRHYPGQHEAIIPLSLWERVQKKLSENIQGERSGIKAKEPSPLVGLVFDEGGMRFTPSHTAKGRKRYRYYVSQAGKIPKRRIPANDLEQIVTDWTATFLTAGQKLLDSFVTENYGAVEQEAFLQAARLMAEKLASGAVTDKRALFQAIIERIVVNDGCIDIRLNRLGVKQALLPHDGASAANTGNSACAASTTAPIILTAPARLMRCGLEVRLIVAGEEPKQKVERVSQSLIKAMARGRSWYEQLTSQGGLSVTDLAQSSGVNDRYTSRILRFAFMSPDIVEAILEGKQPTGMTLEKTFANMPLSWEKQRQIFWL